MNIYITDIHICIPYTPQLRIRVRGVEGVEERVRARLWVDRAWVVGGLRVGRGWVAGVWRVALGDVRSW